MESLPTQTTASSNSNDNSNNRSSHHHHHHHHLQHMPQFPIKRYVTDLQPYDVLLGRGTGPNCNNGNIAFRVAVERIKLSYLSTSSRKEKNGLIRIAIEAVKAKDGRFLKRLKKNQVKLLELPRTSIIYEVVSDDIAIEKTKQALRYARYKKVDVQIFKEGTTKTSGSNDEEEDGNEDDEDDDLLSQARPDNKARISNTKRKIKQRLTDKNAMKHEDKNTIGSPVITACGTPSKYLSSASNERTKISGASFSAAECQPGHHMPLGDMHPYLGVSRLQDHRLSSPVSSTTLQAKLLNVALPYDLSSKLSIGADASSQYHLPSSILLSNLPIVRDTLLPLQQLQQLQQQHLEATATTSWLLSQQRSLRSTAARETSDLMRLKNLYVMEEAIIDTVAKKGANVDRISSHHSK